MNYQEVLTRALKGRSVNAAAKAMGLPQTSLDRWVKGKNLPDYSSAATIAEEAGISLGQMMEALVQEDRHRKEVKETFLPGFPSLTNAWNRLFIRVSTI